MTLRILSGLVFLVATGCFSTGPHVTTTLPAVPVTGHAQIRINADDASVRVTSADIAQVELRVDSAGYDVARDLTLSMTPNGSAVDIVARTRSEFQLFNVTIRSLHLDIRVPREVDVEVSSGDGSVELDAIAGSVDIRTGDGDVTVRGTRGTTRLHTGDGSINARGLDGSVDATTGDGSVTLQGRFDVLVASTGTASSTPAPYRDRGWCSRGTSRPATAASRCRCRTTSARTSTPRPATAA
jgi:DUF4097 and DUF4098 domain-containing protein YvlB